VIARKVARRVAGWGIVALWLVATLGGGGALGAQGALDALPASCTANVAGRFSVISCGDDARLARSYLEAAQRNDSFPGLPRPTAAVSILVAPDAETFRAWVGETAPEWGAAVAFPALQRIVMQGRYGAAADGDPMVTLRHELAHLALHEALGPSAPRWFDEGYASFAAGEWGRDEVLVTSFGLVWRGIPTLAGLDSGFYEGAERAQRSYALAHRAVAELAGLDPDRGLGLLFGHWQREGSFERALRRAHGMSSADFEQYWKRRVRRQFGVLALAADLTVLTLVLTVLLGPMWWQRRQKLRRRLEQMREDDRRRDEAERASALAALLGEADGSGGGRIKG
jgi:hypothetical protein